MRSPIFLEVRITPARHAAEHMDIKLDILGSISQLSQVKFSSHSQSPIVHKRERSMDSSTPTLQSPSSSQSWQVPNQQPTGLVLQSCLQCLDRLDSLERHMHEEIQEIRSRFRNTLDSYQSNATMADSDGCDSIVDSQAELDGRNAIARRGEFAIIRSFSLRHLQCIPRFIAPWHVRFRP